VAATAAAALAAAGLAAAGLAAGATAAVARVEGTAAAAMGMVVTAM